MAASAAGESGVAEYRVFRPAQRRAFEVEKVGAREFRVTGDVVDRLIARHDLENPEALPILTVDEPTVAMTLQPNTSPLAGKEGRFVTSRQLRDRLLSEIAERSLNQKAAESDAPDEESAQDGKGDAGEDEGGAEQEAMQW